MPVMHARSNSQPRIADHTLPPRLQIRVGGLNAPAGRRLGERALQQGAEVEFGQIAAAPVGARIGGTSPARSIDASGLPNAA